jgi:hypothetical protein
VGGPQGGHHQLLPQISIPNTATTVAYTLTQPYAFQIPAPPLQQHYQQQFTQQQVVPSSSISKGRYQQHYANCKTTVAFKNTFSGLELHGSA